MLTNSISLWTCLPFCVLLTSIAIFPLVNRQWWDKYYPVVSIGLGILVILYYVFVLHSAFPILDSLHEYISFIALIGSLYVITGGIHIRLSGRSKPITNVIFLAIGALVANIVGTTGASMILIRPYLRVNHYRIKPFHIIFFIFIVSNVGGALTPVGDPPLFMGYLKGIPFFWSVKNLWYIWLFAIAAILIIFYIIDSYHFERLTHHQQNLAEEIGEHAKVEGLFNIFFLAIVLISVFISNPPFLREALIVLAGLGSYYSTSSKIHKKNNFDFIPIKEVSILFVGIFVTMVPALEWIRQNSVNLGLQQAGQYYWTTGAMSSVLDNTPTYLNFLNAALGQFVHNNVDAQINYVLQSHKIIVQAISIGAVFFGAMTYIGNGPNLMVKSIAEQTGAECPSFVSYILKYSLLILLPLFIIIWFLFFR
ncbi:MAG: sodium:proton antiporter [Bacteroidetes bacterium]|nr:sodium:proton antiporter [Bacteroidota bacterium]